MSKHKLWREGKGGNSCRYQLKNDMERANKWKEVFTFIKYKNRKDSYQALRASVDATKHTSNAQRRVPCDLRHHALGRR